MEKKIRKAEFNGTSTLWVIITNIIILPLGGEQASEQKRRTALIKKVLFSSE